MHPGVTGREMEIRRVEPHEHTAAGELLIEAYRSLGDAGDEFYDSELRDVAGRIETGTVLVAESDGRIVGCVTVSFGRTPLSEVEDAGAATIRMLGVTVDARGQGTGEELVRR